MERTLAILKPDCVQRRLIGRVLSRFEDKGLRLVALKMLHMDRALAERLYAVHKGRDFYEPLLAFMTSSPCVALVLEGPSGIAVIRGMLGSTAGTEAAPGTIRGDFGLSSRLNLVHASDSPDSAAREIGCLFRADELHDYELASGSWVVPRV
jgi:nucleoside-diphosphate kinase